MFISLYGFYSCFESRLILSFQITSSVKMASQGASDVHSLTQKAETFWSEIKDLKMPDVTSGKKKGKIYNLGKIFRQVRQ